MGRSLGISPQMGRTWPADSSNVRCALDRFDKATTFQPCMVVTLGGAALTLPKGHCSGRQKRIDGESRGGHWQPGKPAGSGDKIERESLPRPVAAPSPRPMEQDSTRAEVASKCHHGGCAAR